MNSSHTRIYYNSMSAPAAPAVPPPPPGGQEFLQAAKGGERATMEALLRDHDRATLLSYGGKGCSLGFIGHTALHWAAAKNNADLARWLLAEGAAVSARNNAESTPLHTAAQNNAAGVAQLLLEVGKADVNALNADGQTPLVERAIAVLDRELNKNPV